MFSNIFKIFTIMAHVSGWADKSLAPDQDGVVRVTADEAVELVKTVCDAMGWKAEIVVKEE